MSLETLLVIAALIVSLASFFCHRKDKLKDEHGTSAAERAAYAADISEIKTRLKYLEQSYHLLHEWKRLLLPKDLDTRSANIRELIDRTERRLERIDRKLFGGP